MNSLIGFKKKRKKTQHQNMSSFLKAYMRRHQNKLKKDTNKSASHLAHRLLSKVMWCSYTWAKQS